MPDPLTPRERAERIVNGLDNRLADLEAALPGVRRDLEELKELLHPTPKEDPEDG